MATSSNEYKLAEKEDGEETSDCVMFGWRLGQCIVTCDSQFKKQKFKFFIQMRYSCHVTVITTAWWVVIVNESFSKLNQIALRK